MTQYKVIGIPSVPDIKKHAEIIQDVLDKMVSAGWKLVFVNGAQHYFQKGN